MINVRMKPRRLSRKKIVLLLVALAAMLAPLLLLYRQVDARSQMDAARPADAIIVLGSAVYPGGRASPSLYARMQRAIELYRAGYAPALILSGGVGGNPPSEARVMRQIALNAGVPESALILEENSHSTEENLANSKRVMDARGWHTALIVSDPFHLLRAETIARDLGMNAYGSPARTSPTYTVAHLRVWYTLRESLALVWYRGTHME
jgi:uncharacterized SAM-binding protein YcdF (DUF218 family)